MKLRKAMFCVLLSGWMLLSTSCGFFGRQEYVCDINEVATIKIIQLGQHNQEKRDFEYTVLAYVTDCESFVKQLNKVEYSKNWGEPSVLMDGYIVIRIDYKNGDYDLLHQNAQLFHEGEKNNTGYFFFEEDQFNALISAYLPE